MGPFVQLRIVDWFSADGGQSVSNNPFSTRKNLAKGDFSPFAQNRAFPVTAEKALCGLDVPVIAWENYRIFLTSPHKRLRMSVMDLDWS